MHPADDVHEIPPKLLEVVPLGRGRAWTVHTLPFHNSVSATLLPATSLYDPTAVHVEDDVHETPSSVVAVAPLTVGVDWTFHDVPSQISTNASVVRA